MENEKKIKAINEIQTYTTQRKSSPSKSPPDNLCTCEVLQSGLIAFEPDLATITTATIPIIAIIANIFF